MIELLEMTYYGHLAIAVCIGIIISSFIFPQVGRNNIKRKVKRWAINNLDEQDEEDLMRVIK